MENFNDVHLQLTQLKQASRWLKTAPADVKNKIIDRISVLLDLQRKELLQKNQIDVQEFQKAENFKSDLLDRLILNDSRINSMVQGLKAIANYKDPVGQILESKTLANGLILKKIAEPFGVIFFIFESRPNVITEALSIALKSGNVMILKGGKESFHSSSFIYQVINQAILDCGVNYTLFWGLTQVSRQVTDYLLTQASFIDLVIPRGGEHLIQTIKAKSQIPVIKNDRGLCHVYVHQHADLNMAARIVENAKLSRPSVCNAMETLLVDKSVVKDFVPLFFQLIKNKKITLHADSFIKAEIDSQLQKQNVILDKNQIKCVLANQKDYQTEYLSAEMNIKSVVGLQEAIEHIQLYSSKHSESIVTQDEHVARQFQSQVDAACVYWNASTRFTDGMEFGLGGEIGISTDKLHVRGPVGVESLTTGKWVIDGQGQIRT